MRKSKPQPSHKYRLKVRYGLTYAVSVDKELRSEKAAIKWASLCLDVSPRSPEGIAYTKAELFLLGDPESSLGLRLIKDLSTYRSVNA